MTIHSDHLTIDQAAELIGVSPKTVRRMVKAGTLEADRVDTSSGFAYRITRAIAEEERTRRAVVSTQNEQTGMVPLDAIDKQLECWIGKVDTKLAEGMGSVQADVQRQLTDLAEKIGEVQALREDLAVARSEAARYRKQATALLKQRNELRDALNAEKQRSWVDVLMNRRSDDHQRIEGEE